MDVLCEFELSLSKASENGEIGTTCEPRREPDRLLEARIAARSSRHLSRISLLCPGLPAVVGSHSFSRLIIPPALIQVPSSHSQHDLFVPAFAPHVLGLFPGAAPSGGLVRQEEVAVQTEKIVGAMLG